MIPARPDYKRHPLWTEAIALAHDAYAVADAVRGTDPDAAQQLRKAAVCVPAHVAGALAADEEAQRAADVWGAHAALSELAAQAELAARAVGLPGRRESSDLRRRAEALDHRVALELGFSDSGRPC